MWIRWEQPEFPLYLWSHLGQDYLDRATLLGKRIASQLGDTGPVAYLGDRPEACPICHSDLLLMREGRLVCAICDVSGDPIIGLDGKLKGIKWDGGIEKSRFSIFGGKKHDEAMLDTIKAEARKATSFPKNRSKPFGTHGIDGVNIWSPSCPDTNIIA